METVPLIPKPKVLPNLDVSPLLRELFQEELQAAVPSKKLSQNIVTSLKFERIKCEEKETFRSFDYEENPTKRKDNILDFAENVLEAYENHEYELENIRKAEKNIFETQVHYLKREATVLENSEIRNLLALKRQPLFKALDANYVKRYKLLQGDAGLPFAFEAKTDFRVKNFKKWRRRLESVSKDSLVERYFSRAALAPCVREEQQKKPAVAPKREKIRKPRPKNTSTKEKKLEIFRAEPKILFFSEFKLGEVYVGEIQVRNVHTKGLRFQVKPMCPDGPFKVMLNAKDAAKVFPGLSFLLTVEFTPKSLDNAIEDVIIQIEDGSRLLIPLVAYLESPVLKTHKEISEFTKVTTERIASSYIECGPCFTGDTKVTKLRFRCHRGSGEFFIMSSENWNRSYVNTVTSDNILEIPPFRVYPVFFKIEKNEVIDLFVEFLPKNSGTHVENIMIACDNGEIRSLDLLADAVGWHAYFFSFQDSLLKDLPADKDDDVKVKYYLDFEDVMPTGKVEKVFCVSNNSNMPFEFQWKIREANISGRNSDKYLKLSKCQVKIDPESGTFEAHSIWEFLVTITLDKVDLGDYRMVLSLYVLNLPYQCIEEDNTIIQPTGLVRNLYSQSLYGEEECTLPSPELLSLQGTYESLQESIKSYVECQSKVQAVPRQDFCRTTCIPNPGLCAKPLKKSKTFFNIGDNTDDEGLSCACRLRPVEGESASGSCTSNNREDKINDPPRNEVIWDFVDILVDEIELWVEVVHTRVTLEPSVLELCTPLNVGDPPLIKNVNIINHNRSPVTCSWTRPSESSSDNASGWGNRTKGQFSVSILFDNKFGNIKNSSNEEIKADGPTAHDEVDKTQSSYLSFNNGESKTKETSKIFKIFIEPQKTFTVPGLSTVTCSIGISGRKPGRIKEILCLSINDGDLNLNLLILGTIVKKYFTVSPEILDFGVLKQGTRYSQNLTITKENSEPLFWRINQFKFDFKEEKFLGDSEIVDNSIRKQGVLENDSLAVEPYQMDARTYGIKCSLLEIQGQNLKEENWTKQYALTLADVKVPSLSLSSPRFENAILSPSGMMYVGQRKRTKVILTNSGVVETFFTWGHPFGCHSRKIKVEICPRYCRIEKMKKMAINIDLTPLDEGIISHCYVPCFFCRSAEPLILSIVGIAENVNVTFEIVDYPGQTHADASSFRKSPFHHTVLRLPWPIKMYNPNLFLKYISESDILSMKCHCLEVEEEANRAFLGPKNCPPDSEPAESEKSLPSFDASVESGQKARNNSLRKSFTVVSEEVKNSSLSDLSCTDKKLSIENSVQKYASVQSSLESLQLLKPQLEFLNVPFRTPILRQFVIRNETPIETSFQISVLTFGVPKNLPNNRIQKIKQKVMGHSKDAFEEKLAKEKPLVIVVEPSQGKLLGYDALSINVIAYGNTWGEYRDQLLCQIKGIEAAYLKIFVQIVGHPIYFPVFDAHKSAKPTLRFEPLSSASQSLSKQIKVVNRSSIPLTISWIVFLTEPIFQEEEQEENLCADSNANLDSNHSIEESTNSTKVYIPKNATESSTTIRNMVEMKGDFSQNSATFESFGKTGSTKTESRETREGEKSLTMQSFSEEGKQETQSLSFPGRLDSHVFQVEPKEISFEPFEEKKMTITFNADSGRPNTFSQEFKGVLTGCVKLKPEDEKCPLTYYRPCGINFVSELMDFSALVETPLLSFEILKGDLRFIVDSNAVIKSPSKQMKISRKYLVKNKKEKFVSVKIEVVPGLIFSVKSVSTIDKLYPKYNPDSHILKIEPGQLLEMELQCSITYKDVMYAYEQLKQKRKKEQQPPSPDDAKTSNQSEAEEETKMKSGGEPWRQFFESGCETKSNKEDTTGNSNLWPRDSFNINVRRMSSKSNNLECSDVCDYFSEMEGECVELPFVEEPGRPKLLQHITVVQEEICFVQTELITQSLFAELHLSFPALKLSPKTLDFGNVYIGTPAVRYFSIINLTGFPSEFRVKAKYNASDFEASPLTGSVPATNYNSDIGETITIEFKPSQPGYFKEVFQVFCNLDMEFDFFELFVAGFGTWNEKYKPLKFETYTKLDGIYPYIQR